jgi:hypothetical protein
LESKKSAWPRPQATSLTGAFSASASRGCGRMSVRSPCMEPVEPPVVWWCEERDYGNVDVTCPPDIDPSLGINHHRVCAHRGDLDDIAILHALDHSGDRAVDL